MKKADFISLIIYAIMLVAIFLGCYYYALPTFNASISNNGMLNVLFCLITIIGSFIVGGIFLELGHVVGAKMGKYEIISVNIFGLCIRKVDGKFKFMFKGFDGLLGETIVSPKYDEEGNCISKPKSMLWMGNLFLVILVAISGVLAVGLTKTASLFATFAGIVAISSGSLLFYNFVPLQLDNKNDGYQLSIASKPSNLKAFNESLRVRACEVSNVDPGEVKIFDEITDYTSKINMVSYYKYLEEENYTAALDLLNKILNGNEKISDTLKNDVSTHKLFILLYTNKIDEAKKYYEEVLTQDDRRFLSNSKKFLYIRTYILVSAILDVSESEIQYATSRADRSYKRVDPLRKDVEAKLYKGSLKIAKELHPNWELVVKDEK